MHRDSGQQQLQSIILYYGTLFHVPSQRGCGFFSVPSRVSMEPAALSLALLCLSLCVCVCISSMTNRKLWFIWPWKTIDSE